MGMLASLLHVLVAASAVAWRPRLGGAARPAPRSRVALQVATAELGVAPEATLAESLICCSLRLKCV